MRGYSVAETCFPWSGGWMCAVGVPYEIRYPNKLRLVLFVILRIHMMRGFAIIQCCIAFYGFKKVTLYLYYLTAFV